MRYKYGHLSGATHITENIVIGGEKDIEEFLSINVNAIIDLRNHSTNNIKVPTQHLKEYIQAPMYDGVLELNKSKQNLLNMYKELHKLTSKNHKVAVMCHEGKSRSASVITLYLMSTGLSVDDAYKFIRNKREVVAIHPDLYDILESIDQNRHLLS